MNTTENDMVELLALVAAGLKNMDETNYDATANYLYTLIKDFLDGYSIQHDKVIHI